MLTGRVRIQTIKLVLRDTACDQELQDPVCEPSYSLRKSESLPMQAAFPHLCLICARQALRPLCKEGIDGGPKGHISLMVLRLKARGTSRNHDRL